ncbi:nicotinamidase [Pseudonocardia ailaonensis]|uniref:Nicotinamidase n=1 Tax=Pseudonocardia ailaonensis TaxID=367279 RepID=A0ABN2N4P2_9PSEU
MSSPTPADALLLVNMQNSFCAPAGVMYAPFGPALQDIDEIIERCAEVVAFARAAHTPVIYFRQVFQPGYADYGPLEPHVQRLLVARGGLTAGTWDAAIVDGLKPADGDLVVDGNRRDAFYGTSLEILLRSMGVRHLALAGVATNSCVETTARSAAVRDYAVTVLADCTTSRSSGHRRLSLTTMSEYRIAGIATGGPTLFRD